MFSSMNRTLFNIPITWNRFRFEATRLKCRQARKLIQHSINSIIISIDLFVQLNIIMYSLSI